MRIVSLLPAATDFVAVLGRLPDLVGRTHECDWPVGALDAVPVVTGTEIAASMSSREISTAVGGARHSGSALYTLRADLLAGLRPDIVLTQDLCEVCAVSYARVSDAVRVLSAGPTVLSLEPDTLAGVLGCLRTLGQALDAPDAAERELARLTARLDAVTAAVRGKHRPRVAVIEWMDPVWPAGHWVPEQVARAGGVPLLASAGQHTTPVHWEAVVDAGPEVLLLAPCGFPPDRTRAELDVLADRPGWRDLPAVRADRVWVLDGPAYFNRPGPRVVRGVEVLAHMLHGVPADPPVATTEASRVTA